MRLSVVLGTYNRLQQLQRCLESVRRYCTMSGGHETIVVDGGSTDGTLDYLEKAAPSKEGARLWVIRQGELLGACKAFNAGFAVARGTYVANLNDDAWLCDYGLQLACALMDVEPDIGQVALPFGREGQKPRLDRTFPLAGERRLYANFGVTRRELGNWLRWWGTDYHTYGGDAELSLKIHNVGWRVVSINGTHVLHEETNDDLRRPNTDSPKFYAKWRQWAGPGDPDPQFGTRGPHTVQGRCEGWTSHPRL